MVRLIQLGHRTRKRKPRRLRPPPSPRHTTAAAPSGSLHCPSPTSPASVIPAKSTTQRGRPHTRHSCEGRNPEGLCPRGAPPPPTPAASPTSPTRAIPTKPATQRVCPRAGQPCHQPLPLPRLPPLASFPRSQQPRKAAPPSRHSCAGRNPEGLSPILSANYPNIYNSREANNSRGAVPTLASFPRSQQPRRAGQGEESLPPLVGEG